MATIERNGTSGSTDFRLMCSSGKSVFRQNGNYYTEIGTSMNQAGGTIKVFERFNSTGGASDSMTVFVPFKLGERDTAASIQKDSIYMYNSGSSNFPVYQRVTGTNDGMNRIVSTRTGSTAPSANAMYIGEMYLDTTNKKLYIATSIGSGSDDWTILN